MNKETPIMREIRAALLKTGRVQIWRNNCGVATYGRAKVPYGLGLGSADLIGILKGSGRFFAVEVKTPDGELKPDQRSWHASVRASGGFVCVARSVADALAALERAECGGVA